MHEITKSESFDFTLFSEALNALISFLSIKESLFVSTSSKSKSAC
jgi:hypothetical protein